MRPRRAAGALLAGVVLALGVTPITTASAAAPRSGPQPRTPIRHVVTLMQENHTFDNYFGTYPGADGIPAGVCIPAQLPARQPCVKSFAIGRRPVETLDHDAATLRTAINGGAMNGFVTAQDGRLPVRDLTMGHYERDDVSYYWNLASQNVLFDRFFSSSPGGSVANHLYWVAGTGAGLDDTVPPDGLGNLPTIFDRLDAAGVSWKFYVQNYEPRATYRRGPRAARSAQVARVPLLAFARYIDDPRLFSHIVPVSQYFEDLRAGKLPAVSYIVPSGSSERPPSSISSGQRFVRSLVDGLASSSAWSSSAFVWSYDGWGGWYDHVPPPRVDAVGYGTRVPALLVSAYARSGYVDHRQLDATSVLRFIEDNWSLPPLSTRDATAASLAPAFDFAAAPRPAVLVPTDHGPAAVARSRTSVVLALYGLAVLGALGLIVFVARRGRPRREVVHP